MAALKKMKKLCGTSPKAVAWAGFSGYRNDHSVMATARIGVGTAAPKKINGR